MDIGSINGVDIPSFDPKVTEFLSSKRIDGYQGNMVTAIQNEKKRVYRVIHTEGLGEYIQLVAFLTELGLVDQLADSMDGRNGYDSLFTISD